MKLVILRWYKFGECSWIRVYCYTYTSFWLFSTIMVLLVCRDLLMDCSKLHVKIDQKVVLYCGLSPSILVVWSQISQAIAARYFAPKPFTSSFCWRMCWFGLVIRWYISDSSSFISVVQGPVNLNSGTTFPSSISVHHFCWFYRFGYRGFRFLLCLSYVISYSYIIS